MFGRKDIAEALRSPLMPLGPSEQIFYGEFDGLRFWGVHDAVAISTPRRSRLNRSGCQTRRSHDAGGARCRVYRVESDDGGHFGGHAGTGTSSPAGCRCPPRPAAETLLEKPATLRMASRGRIQRRCSPMTCQPWWTSSCGWQTRFKNSRYRMRSAEPWRPARQWSGDMLEPAVARELEELIATYEADRLPDA